ncbi:hypothetical protein GOBAR_DD06381 [Gossypium barbadense]|nr:hypothetical protein GOBAR_DD06381 [Gossypium barbadense]
MGNVAKAYDLKFVVNISELGEDDPLMQNVTRLSPLLNVPWYTTGGSKHDGFGCFLHQVVTCLSDLAFKFFVHCKYDEMRMVVGFHPLVACKENEEEFTAKLIDEPLHHIFVKFGVNVYLSQQGCFSYALQDNVAYIGNPGLIKENSCLGSGNGRYRIRTEMTDGFLLHRLGSLEMVTYFVTSAGEIVNKIVVQQRGRQLVPTSTGLVPLPVLKRGESESHHFQPLLPIFFLCLLKTWFINFNASFIVNEVHGQPNVTFNLTAAPPSNV